MSPTTQPCADILFGRWGQIKSNALFPLSPLPLLMLGKTNKYVSLVPHSFHVAILLGEEKKRKEKKMTICQFFYLVFLKFFVSSSSFVWLWLPYLHVVGLRQSQR
jgi:hypothetical protein